MLVLTFWFIYDRISSNQNIDEIIHYFLENSLKLSKIWMPLTVVALVFVNWSLEAIKWRYLIQKIEQISFWNALKAVISGVTISIFTPNRIGEYAGRVLYIQKADRIVATLITVISSIGQLLITMLFGSLALLIFGRFFYPGGISDALFYIGLQLYAVFFVLALLSFSNTGVLTRILSRFDFLWNRFRKYIKVFSYYQPMELFRVLGISAIRFGVFSLQYFLLFRYFDVDFSVLEGLVLIPVYLITLTAIPTITLAELGVREVVSITVFSLVSDNELGMVSATFFIWLVNLAIPASIGTIFVFQTRIFKE